MCMSSQRYMFNLFIIPPKNLMNDHWPLLTTNDLHFPFHLEWEHFTVDGLNFQQIQITVMKMVKGKFNGPPTLSQLRRFHLRHRHSPIWALIKADDFVSNKFQNNENVKNFRRIFEIIKFFPRFKNFSQKNRFKMYQLLL